MSAATTRLQALADSLACMTEEDFALFAAITPSTAEAWRKRHKGPAFIRLGNRVLYPIKGVAEHLSTLTRTVYLPAKDLL
jgi:hypothetical protein